MLMEYAIFKNKVFGIEIYPREGFEELPTGPKGKPIAIFPCTTRGEQERWAKRLGDLQSRLRAETKR